MKKNIHLLFLLSVLLLLAACGPENKQARPGEMRIVSMAPNITEMLYALGLSNGVVGVSSYSTYPPEATAKPSIGGTYDPNWEKILTLRPSLVIGLDSQEEISARLEQLGIRFLGVPHERIEEIIHAIGMVGSACGAEEKARELQKALRQQIRDLSAKNDPNRKQVLVCIGHDETLSRLYVAGRNTFYDDLIAMAGGVNACNQTAVKYPEISPEGLHAMHPDLIIDLVPPTGSFDSAKWGASRPVITITNDYAFIPGPRFVLLLKDLSTAIRQNH